MALIYQEQIHDLGAYGLLTLTREIGGLLPLPAQKYGQASWHARMAACMTAWLSAWRGVVRRPC